MNRDGGNLELAPQRTLAERLDVPQFVDVCEAFGVDQPLGKCVEHERVIRVGAVGDMDDHGFTLRTPFNAASISDLWSSYSFSFRARSTGSTATSRFGYCTRAATSPRRSAALIARIRPRR